MGHVCSLLRNSETDGKHTHTQNPEIRLETLMSASGDGAEKRDDGSNGETLSHTRALIAILSKEESLLNPLNWGNPLIRYISFCCICMSFVVSSPGMMSRLSADGKCENSVFSCLSLLLSIR